MVEEIRKMGILSIVVLLIVGFWAPMVSADDLFDSVSKQSFTNPTNSWQTSSPLLDSEFSGSTSDFYSNGECGDNKNSDFKILVSKCDPQVVRSDLLAEQSLSVYCQLEAVKMNPFIKSSVINSISFQGDYPEGVQSISYHPAKAGVQSYESTIGDEFIENIGYVVVVLEQQPQESDVYQYISGILTASIKYSADVEYDIVEGDFYLDLDGGLGSSFFGELGSLSVTNYGSGALGLNVNMGSSNSLDVALDVGKTSNIIYLPGYNCEAGFKISFEEYVEGRNKVALVVDGDTFWLREGDSFLGGKCKISNIENISDDDETGKVKITCYGDTFTLNLTKKQNTNSTDGKISENKEFNEGVEIVEQLVQIYPNEDDDFENSYAEKALFEQIILARSIGKIKTQEELMNLFMEKFASSDYIGEIDKMQRILIDYDTTGSYANIDISGSGDKHSILLEELNFINSKPSVVLVVDGESIDAKEGVKNVKYDFKITDISVNSIDINMSGEKDTLEEGDSVSYKDDNNEVHELKVERINTIEVAHIRIIPQIGEEYAYSNFSFEVTVEPRSFPITPEQAKVRADDLNSTIEDLQSFVDLMEGAIKVWKGACIATKVIMAIKVLTVGTTPTGIARQSVMDTFRAQCTNTTNLEKFGSVDECLLNVNDEIENSVKIYADAITTVSDNAEKIKKELKEGDGSKEYLEALKKSSREIKEIQIGDEPIQIGDVESIQQMESILLFQELNRTSGGNCKTNIACTTASTKMNEKMRNLIIQKRQDAAVTTDNTEEERIYNIRKSTDIVQNKIKTTKNEIDDKTYEIAELETDDGGNNRLEIDNLKSQLSILERNLKTLEGQFYILKVKIDTPENSVESSEEVKSNELSSNTIISPQVRYYDDGVNEKLVAIVPFDNSKGWYAYISGSSGTTIEKQSKGYSANGLPNNFDICNVGKNGIIDNYNGGDLCQSFSINQNSYDSFIPDPTMKASDVKDLYDKAYDAIIQANNDQNDDKVTIAGNLVNVGQSISTRLGYECTDFLSPKDCKTMMNVCDWVECPSSRCDFNGKYPIDNIAKTGIVGSILGCNGFACLPGIYSGVDRWLSTLKGQQECLNTRATSGEYVGNCDKLRSIYFCELFVKQGLIFGEVMISKVTTPNLASSVSGGGEYLFQSDFEKLKENRKAFVSDYGADVFGSTILSSLDADQLSLEYCGSWFGTINGGLNGGFSIDSVLDSTFNTLDKMTDFDTPYQIFGSFSEASYTDATVPATSSYDVSYNIYAGSNSAKYSVYLRNPPSTPEYSNYQTYSVSSGIISDGESKIEDRDFTAPSGYKELCIVVNGEENCDFNVVTDNYLVDKAVDLYLENQISNYNITTESACVSTNGVGEFLLNGLEEKDINQLGITRICASNIPDAGSGQYVICSQDDMSKCSYGSKCSNGICIKDGIKEFVNARWVKVGNCGDESIGCWLDSKSVEDSFEYEDSNNIVDSLRYGDKLSEAKLMYETVNDAVAAQKDAIEKLSVNDFNISNSEGEEKINNTRIKLEQIYGNGSQSGQGTNTNKAEALSLYAFLLKRIVEVNVASVPVEISGGVNLVTYDSLNSDNFKFKLRSSDYLGEDSNQKVINNEWMIFYDNKDTGYYVATLGDRQVIRNSKDRDVGTVGSDYEININLLNKNNEFCCNLELKELENFRIVKIGNELEIRNNDDDSSGAENSQVDSDNSNGVW